jgi:ribosomal protein S15P/S13E
VTPKTETLVSALRILSVEIQSGDGVANAVVAEAADRLTLMANLVARHIEETKKDTAEMQTACETMNGATKTIQRLKSHIESLEKAGENLAMSGYFLGLEDDLKAWNKAKEAKP